MDRSAADGSCCGGCDGCAEAGIGAIDLQPLERRIGNDGTAVGQFSYANTSSTSLGSGSEAIGTQSVAIGTGDNNNINDYTNTYGARGSNGTAVGFAAIANSNATAIGHGAQATGFSSVALGIEQQQISIR